MRPATPPVTPRFGLQGPVVGWQDPWAGPESDRIMRTGTGRVYPSQDPAPGGAGFLATVRDLGCDFYVHHMLPDGREIGGLLADARRAGVGVVLGNEYGNINGPWLDGTNRFDVPGPVVAAAAAVGCLEGVLYDEPEHLQINAGQYRTDGWFPHWGRTDGLTAPAAKAAVTEAMRQAAVRLSRAMAGRDVPVVTEHVFPLLFHASARAGMTVAPKVMKESFQSLQLASALGAARQYGTGLWICADLWGPDIGPWFTRLPGLPGHSPGEYESALRLAYLLGPTHLFTEGSDVLLRFGPGGGEGRHDGGGGRARLTEFGEAWRRFRRDYVPRHPLAWSHRDVSAGTAIIWTDNSNYGQNARLFGNRELAPGDGGDAIFRVWHLVSHGTIPAHGSCMHIPGYEFPRARLKELYESGRLVLPGPGPAPATASHGLFYPMTDVLVFDEDVGPEVLGQPRLIFLVGGPASARAQAAAVAACERGATVIVDVAAAPPGLAASTRRGRGWWIVTGDVLDDRCAEITAPLLGAPDCWRMRFGQHEVRMYRANDSGTELDFEVAAARA